MSLHHLIIPNKKPLKVFRVELFLWTRLERVHLQEGMFYFGVSRRLDSSDNLSPPPTAGTRHLERRCHCCLEVRDDSHWQQLSETPTTTQHTSDGASQRCIQGEWAALREGQRSRCDTSWTKLNNLLLIYQRSVQIGSSSEDDSRGCITRDNKKLWKSWRIIWGKAHSWVEVGSRHEGERISCVRPGFSL